MANYVAVDDNGFIYQVFEGDQSEDKMLETLALSTKLFAEVRNKHGKAYGLVDLSKIGHVTPAARKAITNAIRMAPDERTALYGASTFNRALTVLVLHATGKDKQIKMFNTKAEAIKWLKDEDNAR